MQSFIKFILFTIVSALTAKIVDVILQNLAIGQCLTAGSSGRHMFGGIANTIMPALCEIMMAIGVLFFSCLLIFSIVYGKQFQRYMLKKPWRQKNHPFVCIAGNILKYGTLFIVSLILSGGILFYLGSDFSKGDTASSNSVAQLGLEDAMNLMNSGEVEKVIYNSYKFSLSDQPAILEELLDRGYVENVSDAIFNDDGFPGLSTDQSIEMIARSLSDSDLMSICHNLNSAITKNDIDFNTITTLDIPVNKRNILTECITSGIMPIFLSRDYPMNNDSSQFSIGLERAIISQCRSGGEISEIVLPRGMSWKVVPVCVGDLNLEILDGEQKQDWAARGYSTAQIQLDEFHPCTIDIEASPTYNGCDSYIRKITTELSKIGK